MFSLSIRLFANLMAGHVLMKILIGFAWSALTGYSIGLPMLLFPTIVMFSVTGLESAIALLQAYVFVTLLCIYINDVINTH